MRLPLLLVVAALLVAGCASRPAENGASASSPTPNATVVTNVTPATPTSGGGGAAAFVLGGPVLRFTNGTPTTTFHEDDIAVAHYELSLTSDAQHDGTAFAAYLVNGKVVDVQSIHLNPGETKKFDPQVSLLNLSSLSVQVKVGAAQGTANATLVKWPRMAQSFALGAASLTLTYWTGSADQVSAKVSAWTPADGSVASVQAALLCRSSNAASGVGAPQDAQALTLAAGQAQESTLGFPGCAQPYGLQLTASDAGGEHSGRVLFEQ